jgi:hypothetical protein
MAICAQQALEARTVNRALHDALDQVGATSRAYRFGFALPWRVLSNENEIRIWMPFTLRVEIKITSDS